MDSTINTNSYITTSYNQTDIAANPDGILGKDDFMMLLLTELQYQDPTDPMDTEKILTQTSQLATLESQENTNKLLENLANQLSSNQSFSMVSAIGKMASIGTNEIPLSEGSPVTFEMYFQDDIQSGTIEITDRNGNIVKTFPLVAQSGGVLAFEWDGLDDSGNQMPEGFYSITANYLNSENIEKETEYGVYPIESVRFDGGETYLKLGSSYVPMSYIVEVY